MAADRLPQWSLQMLRRWQAERVAVITEQDAIDRILSHLSLPQQIEALGSNATMGCEITDEQVPEWEWSQLVSEPDERGPPSENDWIDPPFLDD